MAADGAAPKSALIIIDVQKGFNEPVWGKRNNPEAEANIAELLRTFRAAGGGIFHVRHHSQSAQSPLRAEFPGSAFKDEVLPLEGEPVITKTVHNAFVGTDLEKRLREGGYSTLVITGLTTEHCVSTTARMGGDLGFKVYVVADATAAFDHTNYDGSHYSADEVHALALTSLHNEFGKVVTTADVLARE